MRTRPRWAGILAGGNGTRLQGFTKALTGDDRPKQFCRLLGNDTLLAATRTRVSPLVAPERTLCVVTRHHAAYYQDELGDLPSYALIEQPVNKGTTAAIAYAVARVASIAPDAVLALFPADHHYDAPSMLRQTTAAAYEAAAIDHDRLFLIGAEPARPETEYGYIEQGAHLPEFRAVVTLNGPIRGVTRFIEKPSLADATALLRRRCLWNTFVLVGHVDAFVGLLNSTLPGLYREFRALWSCPDEIASAAHLYDELPASDFSTDVLTVRPERLGVVPLPAGNWTDLGQPSRVLEVMANRQSAEVPIVVLSQPATAALA